MLWCHSRLVIESPSPSVEGVDSSRRTVANLQDKQAQPTAIERESGELPVKIQYPVFFQRVRSAARIPSAVVKADQSWQVLPKILFRRGLMERRICGKFANSSSDVFTMPPAQG